MQEVGIAIPAHDEAPNLEILLPRLFAIIEQYAIPAQVYVIDGHSTDGTPAVAQRLGAHVIPQRGDGYGGAIKTAFEDIDARFIITMDADYSHHPVIVAYLYHMRDKADIVIASRYVAQGFAQMPWGRKILSHLLNAAFRFVLSLDVHDLSSGFRLYRRGEITTVPLRYSTYAILQEILVRAYCNGFRVLEIPFHYLPRRSGATHARLFRFGRDYLAALWSLWNLRNSIESADYDSRAFHSRIPLQRWWQRQRYKIILEFVGDRLRVLDAGCGSTQILNGAPQIVGMDIQPRKLRFMRRAGRRLVNASAFALPFKNEAFEAVISSEVIEHIPESDVVFEEMVRCLEPGGLLILGTPDYGSWQWPLIEKLYGLLKPSGYADEHITHYTRKTLTDRIEKMGLVVEDCRYILHGEFILKARKPDGNA